MVVIVDLTMFSRIWQERKSFELAMLKSDFTPCCFVSFCFLFVFAFTFLGKGKAVVPNLLLSNIGKFLRFLWAQIEHLGCWYILQQGRHLFLEK